MRIEFNSMLIISIILIGFLEMLGYCAEGNKASNSCEKHKQEITDRAVKSLEGHLDQFRLEVQYHGPDKKKSCSLWLSTSKPPKTLPAHYFSVQISKAQAKKIIKHLAETDFLWRGSFNRWAQLEMPKSPFYTLYVESKKGDAYFEHVVVGRALVKQLKGLSGVLDGKAEKAMKKLIESLQPEIKNTK